LQLIECIELIKNDVKKKMTLTCILRHARKSCAKRKRKNSLRQSVLILNETPHSVFVRAAGCKIGDHFQPASSDG